MAKTKERLLMSQMVYSDLRRVTNPDKAFDRNDLSEEWIDVIKATYCKKTNGELENENLDMENHGN